MTAPLVGITGRRQIGMAGSPPMLVDASCIAFYADYSDKVALAGGLPVLLPVTGDPAQTMERLDALILSGGQDVDPRRYGQAPGPWQTPIDPVRDAYEIALVEAALGLGRPVLAICRGLQLLNVALGGTLRQHLAPDVGEAHSFVGYPRSHRHHQVDIVEGSRLSAVLGRSVLVNSYHHQSIDRPGQGLDVVAEARDGVVEAVESGNRPVLGVQWHPEMFDEVDGLFVWLVDQATNQIGRQ